MFPRKTLDLVILSILDEYPEGLTGYALVKEMKHKFGKIMKPSPGTIYPRSNRLKESGDISYDKNGTVFKITEQGKKRLMDNIPNVMDSNLAIFPMLYKILMRPLPIRRRMNYLGCAPNFDLFEDSTRWEDFIENQGFYDSEETLIMLKKRLENTRDKIDNQIKKVDEKIRLIGEEKKKWIKIPIFDGESEDN